MNTKGIFLGSAIITSFLVFFTFFVFPKDLSQEEIKNLFFSGGLYVDTRGNGEFEESSKEKPNGKVFFQKIGMNEKIYFSNDIKLLPDITEKEGKRIITLKEGLYLVSHFDITKEYEFLLTGKSSGINFKLSPVTAGIFLIQNIAGSQKIYAYNGALKTELFNQKQSQTQFTLFPWIFFGFNESLGKDMKNADMVRIAMLNTLQYLDPKSENLATTFNSPDFVSLTKSAFVDIKNTKTMFDKLFSFMKDYPVNNIEGIGVMDKYGFLLFNDSKKGFLLQQQLLENILSWYRIVGEKSPKTAELNEALSRTAQTLQKIQLTGGYQYNQALLLLDRCFSLAFFANINQDNLLVYKKTATAWKTFFSGNMEEKIVFQPLLAGFYGYVFSVDAKETLDGWVNKTLQSLALPKSMGYVAPSLTFFLTQYVEKDMNMSESLFTIVRHIFTSTAAYSRTLDNNADKYVILATNYYYNSSVFERLYNNIVESFFEKKEQGMVIKKSFTYDNGDLSVPPYVLEGITTITDGVSGDIRFNQRMFYSLKRSYAAKDQRDDFSKFTQIFGKFNELKKIFLDYKAYQRQLALDPSSRSIQGLNINSDGAMLTLDYPKTYLGQFNNIELSTLKVLNNFKADKLFHLNVNILGNTFDFRLRPEGNILSEVVIEKASGEKINTFKALSFSLDQKEISLKEMMSSAITPEKQYYYNFKNIFETTFLLDSSNIKLTDNTATTTSSQSNVSSKMTPEMQVFAQQELIERDFKYVQSVLSIGFKNIYAEISGGKYQIQISSVKTQVTSTDSTISEPFPLEFSSEYDYPTHSFVDPTITLFPAKDAVSGRIIHFKQKKISVLSFKNIWNQIAPYLSVIRTQDSNEEVIFDFDKKVVIVGSVSYPVR